SPVLTSHPQAPRCCRFLRTCSALRTMSCDLRPLMSTTKPTPHASRSSAGSYSPWAAGGPGVASEEDDVWIRSFWPSFIRAVLGSARGIRAAVVMVIAYRNTEVKYKDCI